MFPSRLRAALLHLVVSILIATAVAFVVYGVWYPGRFAEISGGTGLFRLILLVELILGPVMSLVIYNPKKSMRELLLDYSIVGAVQMGALIYGLYSVSLARPVFLVFVVDRIEVVSAANLSQEDLALAQSPCGSLPWGGPQLVCAPMPENSVEKNAVIMSALSGKDLQFMPKYYRTCKPEDILGRAKGPESWFSVERLSSSLPPALKGKKFNWLPLMTGKEIWTIFFVNSDLNNREYAKVDPF